MSKSKGIRVSRNVSFPSDMDAWLTEMLGEKGNLSGFVQALVELVRSGKVDTRDVMKRQPESDSITRAVKYLKAKEAGMLFEEDVAGVVQRAVARGQRVVRGRIHNGDSPLFIADFSIEDEKTGAVQCSVVCKSSPRADRLQLALAEAMIGRQKTGRPVITVVPYFMEENSAAEVVGQFTALGYQITDLKGLPGALVKGCRGA